MYYLSWWMTILLGVFVLGAAVLQYISGAVELRNVTYTRKEDRLKFWAALIVEVLLGLLFIFGGMLDEASPFWRLRYYLGW